jgi:hypothetical protein
VRLVTDVLGGGHSVRFRASGDSMQPAICHGDVLTVAPVVSSNIAPGSIAVYSRLDRLFVHRVARIDTDHSGAPVFVMRGDAASSCDAPVTASQILGEVLKVERQSRTKSVWLVSCIGTLTRRFTRTMGKIRRVSADRRAATPLR